MLRRHRLVAAAALAAFLAACTHTPTPSESASPSATSASPSESASPSASPSATSASPTASASPDYPFAAPPLQGNAYPDNNTSALITDIQVGEHDGFARLVIEYADESGFPGDEHARPGFDVNYVKEAIAEANGEPLTIDAPALLDIRLSGTAAPDEGDPQPYRMIEPTQTFKEIRLIGPFEGIAQIVLGLDKQRPVRVFELDDPYRIVIDVSKTD